MCTTCGCSAGDAKQASHSHPHDSSPHADGSAHTHDLTASSEHGKDTRLLQVELDLLAKNDHIAAHNRAFFKRRGIHTLNLVSSPGAGKTTLLVETLKRMKPHPCAVIEGDQQTSRDADRIRAEGGIAVQINTGKGCHLDAQMVANAIEQLTPQPDSTLFIENVGNLVCPAGFDLGEAKRVVILSVTEGDDKPIKYPDIFAKADLMVINKTDLLPYVEFDIDACVERARQVNPSIQHMQLSASSGAGMHEWLNWLGEC